MSDDEPRTDGVTKLYARIAELEELVMAQRFELSGPPRQRLKFYSDLRGDLDDARTEVERLCGQRKSYIDRLETSKAEVERLETGLRLGIELNRVIAKRAEKAMTERDDLRTKYDALLVEITDENLETAALRLTDLNRLGTLQSLVLLVAEMIGGLDASQVKLAARANAALVDIAKKLRP